MEILIEATEEYQEEHGSWGGVELITLDFDKPEPFTTIYQFWDLSNSQMIKYKVSISIKGNDVHIEYDPDCNRHLPKDVYEEVVWGTHILHDVNPDNKDPSSTWISHEDEKPGDPGPGPGWRVEDIVGEPRIIPTTKLQKEHQKQQNKFRKMLLDIYGCCAVTGETCHDVLDAAHIVAVKNGGRERLSNGILLRADLHRLFDTDPPKFAICPETGQITTAYNFDYRGFELNGRKIDNAILRRVRDALLIRRSNIQ